jgi:hypothetical protein
VPLLVHLDREDANIAALVVVLADGGVERLVQLRKPLFDDLAEAHQHGQINAAQDELIHQLLQVNGPAGLFRRMNGEVAFLVDREKAFAPTRDVVEFGGVAYRPAVGRFPGNGSGFGFDGQGTRPLRGNGV